MSLQLKNYEQYISDNNLKLNLSKNNMNSSFIVNNKINDEVNNLQIQLKKFLIFQK